MKHFILAFLLIFSLPLIASDSGTTAPNIFGRTLDNKLFRLSDLKGPMVVNFFWVECVPCKKEMPELAELGKQHPKVKIISVHVEDEEQATVQKFIDQLPAHPETIVTASPAVKNAYKIKGLPHTVVINNGKVISVFAGYTHKGFERLKQLVGSL